MLELVEVNKTYSTAAESVCVLEGVSLTIFHRAVG
jgi:hypothetical protein